MKTLIQTSTFEIYTNEDDYYVMNTGHVVFCAIVKGYWSSNIINATIRRNFRDVWEIAISHSSGGRDRKVIASDIIAERNMGVALIAVSDFMSDIDVSVLETAYQNYQTEVVIPRQQKEQQVLLEAKAALDADPAITEAELKKLIRSVKQFQTLTLYRRASDEEYATIERGGNDEYYVRLNSVRGKEMSYSKLTFVGEDWPIKPHFISAKNFTVSTTI